MKRLIILVIMFLLFLNILYAVTITTNKDFIITVNITTITNWINTHWWIILIAWVIWEHILASNPNIKANSTIQFIGNIFKKIFSVILLKLPISINTKDEINKDDIKEIVAGMEKQTAEVIKEKKEGDIK